MVGGTRVAALRGFGGSKSDASRSGRLCHGCDSFSGRERSQSERVIGLPANDFRCLDCGGLTQSSPCLSYCLSGSDSSGYNGDSDGWNSRGKFAVQSFMRRLDKEKWLQLLLFALYWHYSLSTAANGSLYPLPAFLATSISPGKAL